MRFFISPPNQKIAVRSFSLMPLVTCPGRSNECASICYSAGFVRMSPNLSRALTRNTLKLREIDSSKDWEGFVRYFVRKLKRDGDRLFRWHVHGDFESEFYVRAVSKVVHESPQVQFWAYTRSWRCPELLPTLEKLRAEPNMSLLASIDKTIGEEPPKGWSIAAMADDMRWHRKGAVICPYDQGRETTCAKCQLCLRPGATILWPIKRPEDRLKRAEAA